MLLPSRRPAPLKNRTGLIHRGQPSEHTLYVQIFESSCTHNELTGRDKDQLMRKAIAGCQTEQFTRTEFRAIASSVGSNEMIRSHAFALIASQGSPSAHGATHPVAPISFHLSI
jgi:hypothetical protein